MQLFRKRLTRAFAVGAAAVATSAVLAPSALAANPTGEFADFKYCPRAISNVEACLYSEVTSGSFKLGNANVPITSKIVLQGGVSIDYDTFQYTFHNAVGAPTLTPTKLNVPGGLTGLFDPQPGWNGLLVELLEGAINAANGVQASASLVGPVGFDMFAFASQSGPAVTLPVRIKLDNPFLGSNCYIGSASKPVVLRLTTGTTAPPAPNTPISGDTGTVGQNTNGTIFSFSGFKLVDNAFAVPAATGCGPLLFRPLINAAVNLKEGFPSAAGKNAAIMQGSLKQAERAAVDASAGS